MSTSVPPPGWTERGRPEPVPTPAVGGPERRPRRPRSKLAGAVLAVAAFTGLAFVLLGSAGSQFDPIARAAALSAQSPGYRVHMTMQFSSSLEGAFTAEANGVVDLRDRAASMTMTMNLPDLPQVTSVLGGNTLTMNMLVEGTVVYMEFPPALADKLPYDKPWLELDMGKVFDSEGLSGVSSMMNNPVSESPTSQLAYLRATSGDVLDEGPAVINGVVTTHYHADVDLSRVVDVVPAAERSVMSQTISKLESMLGTDQMPIDVWIDHRHLVRQVVMSLNFTPAGGSPVQESMTADMTNYGPQSRPAPPPASQVQNVTALGSFGS